MATALTTAELTRALVTELGTAIGSASGRQIAVIEAADVGGPGWSTPLTVTGPLDGVLTAWIDADGLNAIAARVTGLDEPSEPSVATDMQRELWRQVAASITTVPALAGVTIVVGTPTTGELPPGGAALALKDGATTVATVSVAGTLTVAAISPASVSARQSIPTAFPGNLAALLEVDLPLVVRFARTEMSLGALAQLGPGSMVDMGRSPDAPVQLMVGAHVIAEGEVVVVAGNYGVRITSLVSPADRLKAIEL